MPAVVSGRKPLPRALAPTRVALAVQPEILRKVIPPRVTLRASAVPFAGELREEAQSTKPLTIPIGGVVVLCSLRRPWNYVGFAIDPGNAVAATLVAALRVRTAGFPAIVQTPVPIGSGLPSAFPAIILAAQADLIVTNTSVSAAAVGVRGAIWGMSEC